MTSVSSNAVDHGGMIEVPFDDNSSLSGSAFSSPSLSASSSQGDLTQPAPSKSVVKLIPAKNVTSEAGKSILKQIDEVDEAVRKIRDMQIEISEKLFKGEFDGAKYKIYNPQAQQWIQGDKLKDWSIKLNENSGTIAAQRTVILKLHQQMPVVPENELQEQILENIKALHHALSVLGNDCARMKKICDAEWFANAAEWHRTLVAAVDNIKKNHWTGTKSYTEKVDALTKLYNEELKSKPQSLVPKNLANLDKSLQREVRTLYMRGYFFYIRMLVDIKKELEDPNVQVASGENVAQLVAQLANIQIMLWGVPKRLMQDVAAVAKISSIPTSEYEQVQEEIRLIYDCKVENLPTHIAQLYQNALNNGEPAAVTSLSDIYPDNEVLKRLGGKVTLRGQFFIPATDSWKPTNMAYFAWYGTYYEKAKEISKQMKILAKAAVGMVEQLEQFHESNSNFTNRQSLQIDCKVLQTKLRLLYSQLFDMTQTDLHPTIMKYLGLVSHKVEKANRLVRRLFKFDTDVAKATFEAEKKVYRFLAPSDSSQTKAIASLTSVENLAIASKPVAEQYQQMLERLKPQSKSVEGILRYIDETMFTIEGFTNQLTVTLKETLANKGPAAVALTDAERAVFQAIVTRQELTTLKENDEEVAPLLLPAVVKAYIEKRITNLLYISDSSYDLELEILLNILQSEYADEWTETIRTDSVFKKIYEEFRTQKPSELDAKYLKAASQLLYRVDLAAGDVKNVVEYAKACQGLLDLCTQIPLDVSSTKVVQDLIKLVHRRLTEAAEKNHYPLIPIAEVAKSSSPRASKRRSSEEIKERVVAISLVPEKGILVKDIAIYNHSSDLLTQTYTEIQDRRTIFWQVLIAQLYGKPDQLNDAIEASNTFIESNEVHELIKTHPEEFKALICEAAIRKVLNGKVAELGKNELAYLLKGPVEKYLETKQLDFTDPSLLFVLAHLVNTKRSVYDKAKEAMGDKFQDWVNALNQFAQGFGKQDFLAVVPKKD